MCKHPRATVAYMRRRFRRGRPPVQVRMMHCPDCNHAFEVRKR